MAVIRAIRKGKAYGIIVDDGDFEELRQFKWYITAWGYAVHRVGWANGRSAYEAMHRRIMGATPGDGRIIDHKNGNRLDNRRINLRAVTHTENMQNRGRSRVQMTSSLRGVDYLAERGVWRARHTYNGVVWVAEFATEAEADRAVRERRRAVLGYETTLASIVPPPPSGGIEESREDRAA
jgi:hypothetical protein